MMRQSSPRIIRADLASSFPVITGARIGDGQASVGFGVLSFLDIADWLVGFEGRADRYQMLTGEFSGPALELAALVGRRFRFQTLALDLTAGPAAALQGTATYQTMTATKSYQTMSVTKSSSSVAPRLLLGARLTFNSLSTLRTFVGVDGELGPARAPGAEVDVPDAPRLPLWTLGLALGASVGTH